MVLKVELGTGEIEVLITNLSEEELRYEESKELYFKRWGIETKFDELKNKFQLALGKIESKQCGT